MSSTESKLRPGRYVVHLGKQERLATVFEDIDAGTMCVRFEGVERVQRLDEIDEAAQFVPVD